MKNGDIHINWTKTHDKKITWTKCSDCGRFAPFAWFHQDWYGWSTTCLRCGRQWENGEWALLDFTRYARRDSIASAKKRWRQSKTV